MLRYNLVIFLFFIGCSTVNLNTNFSSFVEPDTVTISWYPNIEDDLVGYKVYSGERRRSYDRLSDTKPLSYDTTLYYRQYDDVIEISRLDTSYQFIVLIDTIYFSVTAIDTIGNESEFSSEVSFPVEVCPAQMVINFADIIPDTIYNMTDGIIEAENMNLFMYEERDEGGQTTPIVRLIASTGYIFGKSQVSGDREIRFHIFNDGDAIDDYELRINGELISSIVTVWSDIWTLESFGIVTLRIGDIIEIHGHSPRLGASYARINYVEIR